MHLRTFKIRFRFPIVILHITLFMNHTEGRISNLIHIYSGFPFNSKVTSINQTLLYCGLVEIFLIVLIWKDRHVYNFNHVELLFLNSILNLIKLRNPVLKLGEN